MAADSKNFHPVWLNKTEEEGVALYAAVVARPPGAPRRSFLVLSAQGPVFAKDLAASAAREPIVSCNLVDVPLVTPNLSEIEYFVKGASVVRQKKQARLNIFKFIFVSRKILLVATTRSPKQAQTFAVKVVNEAVQAASLITSALVIDGSATQKMLADG